VKSSTSISQNETLQRITIETGRRPFILEQRIYSSLRYTNRDKTKMMGRNIVDNSETIEWK